MPNHHPAKGKALLGLVTMFPERFDAVKTIQSAGIDVFASIFAGFQNNHPPHPPALQGTQHIKADWITLTFHEEMFLRIPLSVINCPIDPPNRFSIQKDAFHRLISHTTLLIFPFGIEPKPQSPKLCILPLDDGNILAPGFAPGFQGSEPCVLAY